MTFLTRPPLQHPDVQQVARIAVDTMRGSIAKTIMAVCAQMRCYVLASGLPDMPMSVSRGSGVSHAPSVSKRTHELRASSEVSGQTVKLG